MEGCLLLFDSPPRRGEIVVERGMISPKRVGLAQARPRVKPLKHTRSGGKVSLSETGLVAQAKSSSPSEFSAVCMCGTH